MLVGLALSNVQSIHVVRTIVACTLQVKRTGAAGLAREPRGAKAEFADVFWAMDDGLLYRYCK